MVRTPSRDKSGLKKGTWTPEEDRKLIAYVTRYGCWNWRQLPKYAGLARCGKSCRLRWLNYLRPNIRRGNYTPEEEDTIIKLHQKLGNRWSAIAAELPGRTDNDIKNHWHTNLKKRVQLNAPLTQDQEGSGEAQVSNSKDGSQFEPNPNTDPCDDQSLQAASATTDHMVDLCPLSPQSSCSEFSSVTTDNSNNKNMNWVGEDEFAFLEAFADGNFWTEPYVDDIFCIPSETVALSPLLNQPDYFTPLSDQELQTPNNLTSDHYYSALLW